MGTPGPEFGVRITCRLGVEDRSKGRMRKVASGGAYLWAVENKLVSSGLLDVRDVVPVYCETFVAFKLSCVELRIRY